VLIEQRISSGQRITGGVNEHQAPVGRPHGGTNDRPLHVGEHLVGCRPDGESGRPRQSAKIGGQRGRARIDG
jgi:hypothetical protein